MWLKFDRVYHNLERVDSISFRKQTIAFNLKASGYKMVNCRFVLSNREIAFIEAAFEAAIDLNQDIFDMDFLFNEIRGERARQRRPQTQDAY